MAKKAYIGVPQYTELSYIESTGTQYINTDYKSSSNTRVVVDVQFDEIPTSHSAIFGAVETSIIYRVFYNYSNSEYNATIGGSTQYGISYTDPTKRAIIDLKQGTFAVGENKVTLTETAFSMTSNTYLFAQNSEGTMKYPASCRMYSCKIYDNDVLVRDFVPCRRSDNSVGMYDKVSGEFFANKGTGTFIGGVVVGVIEEEYTQRELPAGYKQLAYIESTGTQYIDIGIDASSTLEKIIEVDHEYTDLSTTQIIIGAWKNSSTRFYPISTDGYLGYASNKVSISSKITFATNTRYKMLAEFSKYDQHLIINDEVIYETTISTTAVDSSLNMYLFAVNYNGSADYYAKAKVRSCKITHNGYLHRDFVPCRNASGEAGLYDLVNGQFYGNAGTGEFIGSDEKTSSVARKVKKMYIGTSLLPTGYTPVEYIKSTLGTNGMPYIDTGFKPNQNTRVTVKVNVDSTEQTLRNFFGVSISGKYFYFGYANSYNVAGFASNSVSVCERMNGSFVIDMDKNKFTARYSDSSTNNATYTFTSTTFSSSVSLLLFASNGSYGVSSHSVFSMYYAKIYDNGTLVRDYIPCVNPSGEAGMYDLVTNQFYGDSDTSGYSNGFVAGNPVDNPSFARRVKKAYIGIGGVARPFFSCGILEKWGTATPLSSARRQLAATTVGDYALFGGGIPSNANNSKIVDAYNSSLVHSVPTAFTNVRYSLAATRIGNYALFGGGSGSTGTAVTKTVEAYDASLTHSSTHELSIARQGLAATRVGNYALFGGGKDYSDSYSNVVDAYNLSLTSSTPSTLSTARTLLAATTVGDYALFGGGYRGSYSKIVNAYNTSLTRTTPTALNTSRRQLAATTVGDYALFAGGYNGTYLDVVNAYDTSLTRSTPAVLTSVRAHLAATTIGTYALFGGGCISSSSYSSTVDVYDVSLTHTTSTGLSNTRKSLAATTVGDYALFGGGDSYSSPYERDTVDVYAI